MKKPTANELVQLDRLARKYEAQLKFARTSPRAHQNIPFVETNPEPGVGSAVIGFLIAAGIVVVALWRFV